MRKTKVGALLLVGIMMFSTMPMNVRADYDCASGQHNLRTVDQAPTCWRGVHNEEVKTQCQICTKFYDQDGNEIASEDAISEASTDHSLGE